jgi:NAD(P) transhydrogenase subunit alpha
MKLGVPKETFPGEDRVAIVPAVLPALKKLGLDVVVERDAGAAAGFPDASYTEQQAVVGTRADAFSADILAQVRGGPLTSPPCIGTSSSLASPSP